MMKNRAYHEGIKQTPYKAVFGSRMKSGLKTSNFPDEAISSLQSEEELETIIHETFLDPPEDEEITNFVVLKNGDLEEIASNDENITPNLEKVNIIYLFIFICLFQDNDDTVSLLHINKYVIAEKRKAAHSSLHLQANKMLKYSNNKFPPAVLGDIVKIPIPDVDKGKTDSRNLLCVFISIDYTNYMFETKEGRIKQHYSRNQFTVCKQKFLSITEVPDEEKSLREIVKMQSLTGGHGFKRCFCRRKCDTKRCSYRIKNLLCNSKCHGSGPCNYK